MDNYLMFKTLDSQKGGYLTIQEFLNVFEASPLKWKVLLPFCLFIISKTQKIKSIFDLYMFILFFILYINTLALLIILKCFYNIFVNREAFIFSGSVCIFFLK